MEIKFVAVDPHGKICGPIGDDSGSVENALCVGYIRATKTEDSYEKVWSKIQKIGYSVRKAKITLLGENK